MVELGTATPEQALKSILVKVIRDNDLANPGKEESIIFRTIARGLEIRGRGTVFFYFVFQRISTVQPVKGLDEVYSSPAVFQFVAVARTGAEKEINGKLLKEAELCDAMTSLFEQAFKDSAYYEDFTVERDDRDPDSGIDVRVSTALVRQFP